MKTQLTDILDYKEPITKIYLVRHGQTNANKNRLLFGRLDWDLNKDGIKEAQDISIKLSKILKNTKIDYLISSPLKRAKHTAKTILQKVKAKQTIINKDLIEKSEGTWEGKTFWQVRNEDYANFSKWIKNPLKNRPPNGESTHDLNIRVKRFYKLILKKYQGKNIVIVAHSGPIKLFLLNVLGLNIKKFWNIRVDCGSLTEIHLSKKHSVVWSMNQV